jgi:putative SOS response-associated peptidase YedK
MCGRFTQYYTWRELHDLYALVGAARNIEPRHDVAPTTTIDVVQPTAEGLKLVPMRWGLVPAWWKKPLKELPSTFNARAESVAEKPMFRSAFKRNRCIIPASGFYEWKTIEGKKQRFYITAGDGAPLAMAGLWETWKSPESGEMLLSCTIIVTAANAFIANIHARMPVLMIGKAREAWLDGTAGVEALQPAPEDYLPFQASC